MNRQVSRFLFSALAYCFIATVAGYVLEVPEKVISIAIFLPPILGLMWGMPAVTGAYVGALFVIPELKDFLSAQIEPNELLLYLVRRFWIFAAGYLPYFLRRKLFDDNEKIPLGVETLKKFLIIMLATFAVTSVLRAATASTSDLEAMASWLDSGRTASFQTYMLGCFMNDFFIAMFFDLACFFILVSSNYSLAGSKVKASPPSPDDESARETQRAWRIAFCFYLIFPLAVFYIDKFQIYGMTNIKTWLNFVAQCLSVIDIYLVLMLYLLLRYKRSIMLEVAFLVAQTVFFSATVLGWVSSVAMSNLVSAHTDDSLHAMSVICRERLYRTFFCVRQAVNGMKLQAEHALESYERLAGDSPYRESYLDKMRTDFSSIALGIDGSVSYYLRLMPEIAGTKGGFSMQREDARWEGALSPFIRREPVDLAPYSPDDNQKVGWYYIPMKSHCATWIEPYTDPVTNFYVISYVAPLFVEEKFIGVVGMDIDFNFIIHELRRMSIYDYGYVYLMDRNNVVLYHRYLPQGSLFQPNPEFQEIEVYLANGMWLGIATPLDKVNEERNSVLMHLITAIMVIAMLISIASISLASRAIKPLAGMTEAAKRIASGDLNVKISYESGNELGILVRSIREMAAKLEVYVYRDKLTGLRNAAAYISKAAELDAQNNLVPDLKYGVVIFDANFLKKVNDNYGHEAGNELLRHAAKVIRTVFANSPVYRIGGDEFAAVLEGQDYENRQELLSLFDKLVAEEHFKAANEVLTVSVARGLGSYERGMKFSEVSKKADVAMYNHKTAIKAKVGEEVR